MKTISLIISTFLITVCVYAQTPEKILARVRYTYISKQDTLTKKSTTRSENMLLFISKDASLFTSYDKINHEIADEQKILARNIAGGGMNRPRVTQIDNSVKEWMTTTNYSFFHKAKKVIVKHEFLGTGYLIEEPIPNINWKITKDTTTLSGIACQKATGNYDGKNWVAWFSPSLPFQGGPWKLHGLPGLILEAYTDDRNTQFQFAGFEKANDGDFVRLNDTRKRPNYEPGDISNIDVSMGLDVANAYFENKIMLSNYRTVKTTAKELENLKAAYKKDPKGFAKAMYGY